MSAAHKHAAPEPKPVAGRPDRGKPRWKVVVAQDHAEPTGPIPLEQLRQATHPGVIKAPLPYRPELQSMFAEPLPEVEVRTGAAVEAALDQKGAEAAALDGLLFLRQGVSLPVVAHELAHILQAKRPAPEATPHPGPDPEAEADRIEWRAQQRAALPPVAATLNPGAISYRMQGPLADPAVQQPSAGRKPAAPDPAPPVGAVPGSAPAPASAEPAPAAAQSTPATAPTLAAADIPQLETAESEAASTAALAALDTAEDADAVLAAFAAAPPSVKAQEAPSLGARIDAASARARADEAASLPELRAEMSPGEPLPDAPPVQAPAGSAQTLESTTPAPAPLPELAPTPNPGRASANADIGPMLARDFSQGDPEGLQRTFDRVNVRDSAVDTSAGERPDVPLVGQNDPARVEAQESAAAAQTGTALAEATGAVLNGRGPEQAQLQEISEGFAPPTEAAASAATAFPVAEGAAAFASKPLDGTTVALFDRAHAPAMEASLAGATDQINSAAETRETARNAELASANAETRRLNTEADQQQRAEVIDRRAEIQLARQDTLDQQAAHSADVRQEAFEARATARGEVEAEVSRTETQIAADFATAETRADAELSSGERQASDAAAAAERESEEASWWDRAVNWVKSQLEKLTSAINAIFDAVRAAVRAIIDAVKEAALALIDLAAGLIKGIIEAFGALLKTLVDQLLGQIFPELAAALNAAIDTAVAAATSAIDQIASALKAAVEFLANALAAALDAVLAAWQAAVNVALALASAALTGDWAALARLILTPILMALGIDPDAFFQLFERAAEALDSIVDNPSGFVANLLDTVQGGVQKFADNFPHHLVGGILLWLTGPLGNGIRMPAEFDLMGLLDVARQALGLTVDTLRRVAVRVLGEGAVERIEYVLRYVGALISGGWQGLWEQLTSDLGMLRDMVLDQIKDFLLEKVVMASILWLASMFNPVGALVKLVMTIWNFIQFLRAQLARIFAVVQTVVNNLWQIATGALEPPIQGVERVLAGLLPVALDLLARLIGVTGIPEKVQAVLGAVRLRIETALERLMRRVLAAFGISGREAPANAAPGEIMAPIRFSAGHETHTLLIEDEGETVRPMIHSTPSPLAAWLDQRPGQPFTQLAAEKNWRGVVLNNKRTELLALVAAAKAEEAQLDAEAEATEDAINAASVADASDAAKSNATAKVASTQSKGEQTRSAVERVLEFFGISIVPLDEKFAAELAAMPSALSSNLRQYVLPRLDVARYTPLDWAGFGAMLPGDSAISEPWRRPSNSTGVARRFTDGGFDRAIAAEAHRLAVQLQLPNADSFLGSAPNFEPAKLNRLFGDHLAQRLSGSSGAILAQMLAAGGPNYAQLMPSLASPISEAVTAMCGSGADIHDHSFAQVTGSYFQAQIVNNFRAIVTNTSWGSYFHDDSMNAAGSGAGAAPKPIGFFLRPDPAGSSGSKRAGKNGQRLADAVRGADPGQHEWIASRFAATIIRNAANDVERGNLDKLGGLCELIQFQHLVRTPTRQLIFNPAGPYPAQKVVVRYQAYQHRIDPLWRTTPEAQLPEEQRNAWYPEGRPHQGTAIEILQGHPGAIYARVSDGAPSAEIKPQTVGHGKWDEALERTVSTTLADGTVLFDELHEMADNILGFFHQTIWNGSNMPAGGVLYDEYFNSGGGSEHASTLASNFGGYFSGFAQQLDAQIRQVRSA